MASNIHILIHIIETTMHRRKSPYEDLSDLRSFNRKQGQKSRKSPQGHLPLHKATIFFSYFFLVKWLILKLDFQSPKSRRPSTSTLLKYGHLNMFRLYTSDNVLMMQALVPGKVLQEFGGKPKNLNREWRGPVFFSSFKEWGGGGWDTWRTLLVFSTFLFPNLFPIMFLMCSQFVPHLFLSYFSSCALPNVPYVVPPPQSPMCSLILSDILWQMFLILCPKLMLVLISFPIAPLFIHFLAKILLFF